MSLRVIIPDGNVPGGLQRMLDQYEARAILRQLMLDPRAHTLARAIAASIMAGHDHSGDEVIVREWSKRSDRAKSDEIGFRPEVEP